VRAQKRDGEMKMAKENDIRQELLKQMDVDSAERSHVNANSARKIIEQHKIQLKRLKWIAAISWLIVLIYAIAMHNLKVYLLKYQIEDVLTRNEFWLLRRSDTALVILIIIALLLTYLVYSTSRSTTLLQICSRLANIEEHLKRMSQDR
jgi:hypothetical protein